MKDNNIENKEVCIPLLLGLGAGVAAIANSEKAGEVVREIYDKIK